MIENDFEKVMARGLEPAGTLLLVKNELKRLSSNRIRIIVSNKESVDELALYFKERNAEIETDRVGNDYHVIVDLTNFKEDD